MLGLTRNYTNLLNHNFSQIEKSPKKLIQGDLIAYSFDVRNRTYWRDKTNIRKINKNNRHGLRFKHYPNKNRLRAFR